MSWRLVFLLSLSGLAIGLATTFGLVHAGVEKFVWLVVVVLLAIVIARRAPRRPFVHGVFTGFLAGVLCLFVQGLMFDAYLAHNPSAAQSFQQLPRGMSPRVLMVVLAPLLGALYGVLVGLLAFAIARLTGRSRVPAA